jgi:hypothetical protein
MSSRPQGYELLSLCISHLLNVPPVIRQTLQQGTYLIRSASSYDPKLYLCLMSDEFIGVKRLEHGDDTVKVFSSRYLSVAVATLMHLDTTSGRSFLARTGFTSC